MVLATSSTFFKREYATVICRGGHPNGLGDIETRAPPVQDRARDQIQLGDTIPVFAAYKDG
jgi:hypothetical protein